MLAKKYRIKNGKEYNNIYKNGKRIHGKYLYIYFLSNHGTYNRYGIVTSKAIGKAVKRNQVKRKIRAIIYKNLHVLNRHDNIVIVTKKNINQANFGAIEQDFLLVMKKANIC